MNQVINVNHFLLPLLLFLISSCSSEDGGITAGMIGVFITGAFVVGVLFYFLLRPQDKRKGDNNPKP